MPQPLRRVALLVEYDGSELSGSQLQPGRRTVQGAIEDALRAYDGGAGAERRRAALAGRTDAGVHARGQVAAVSLARRDCLATVRDAFNHYLPTTSPCAPPPRLPPRSTPAATRARAATATASPTAVRVRR